jgi:8-oxo-dGTP pyrophosphatase MutT (NUDIX family)
VRQRVVAYVTRVRDGRRELLVFEDPEHPQVGVQVPAGRLDPGETLDACLRRELAEEAGLGSVRIMRELALDSPWPEKYENHAFEVHVVGDDAADTWEHVVHGDGDDAGLVFRYRWEPVRLDLVLFNRTDPVLEDL